MLIITILLFTCILIAVNSFVIILVYGLFEYSIIPVIICMLLIIIFRIWFYRRCRKYIKYNKNIKQIGDFIVKDANNEGIIKFVKNNGLYECLSNKDKISMDLNGFLLKISFIRAYVVRQLRYKSVSEKLKISSLFKLKLKCEKIKYTKIWLVIDNKKYLIMNSSKYTKNTILSKEISKSMFASMYTSNRTFLNSNVIEKIDEKIYLNYYKFY